MTSVDCHHCGNTSVAMNRSLQIDDKTFCDTCAESLYGTESKAAGKKVSRRFDPTVCAFCEADHGENVLNLVGVYPTCTPCETNIRNKTFPLWVKAFLAFVVFAVVFSFCWNFRFYRAWDSLKQSTQAMDAGDAQSAYSFAKQAALDVPESKDLDLLKSYYHGIQLLQQDSARQALSEFRKSAPAMGEYASQWAELAQMSVYFDEKNYEKAAESALILAKMDSVGAMPWLRVASANSCLYAQKGNDSVRMLAVHNLEKARLQKFSDASDSSYANMIEYRLHARHDITSEEFNKKFPNGWTKPLK